MYHHPPYLFTLSVQCAHEQNNWICSCWLVTSVNTRSCGGCSGGEDGQVIIDGFTVTFVVTGFRCGYISTVCHCLCVRRLTDVLESLGCLRPWLPSICAGHNEILTLSRHFGATYRVRTEGFSCRPPAWGLSGAGARLLNCLLLL